MVRAIVTLACLLLCAASAAVWADAATGDIAAAVEIRAQQRSLQARYTLPVPVLRLPLKREYSAELRQRVWKIRTPGIRLDGNALVGDRPFSEVEIAAEALTQPVPKDYAPLAPFSDGGVAVYTGLFDAGVGQQRTRYRFVPERGDRVVLSGKAQERALDWISEPDGEGTYVYFGRSALVPSGAGLAVLDRALPAWIVEDVDAMFPKLIVYYTERFGRAAPFTPFVLFSFNGSDAGGTHAQGSVLPGLLYLRLDGSAWFEASARNRAGLRWTLAHEAAHFWNYVNRDPDGAQWLHEGSADAFAYRALQALGHMDAAAVAAKHDAALARCLRDLGDDAVNVAEHREIDVAYSCGLVMALYTEAALRQRDAGADLFSFWRALLDESGADGYTQALYLATLAALSGEPKAAAWLGQFADHAAKDRADLPTALARVGVSLRRIEEKPGEVVAVPRPSAD